MTKPKLGQGKSLYNEIMQCWNQFDEVEQAQHKIGDTETYKTMLLAKEYRHNINLIIYDKDVLGIVHRKDD